MRSASHLILGWSALAVADRFITLPHSGLMLTGMILGNALGSLLPDVDSDEAEIRQITHTARHDGCLGLLVSWLMPGHRGLTHSVWVLALFGLLYLMTGRSALVLAVALGYLAHILADMLTRSGVPVLWPLRFRFGLLPRRLRFTTGSLPENLVIALASGWLIIYVLPFAEWQRDLRQLWTAIRPSI